MGSFSLADLQGTWCDNLDHQIDVQRYEGRLRAMFVHPTGGDSWCVDIVSVPLKKRCSIQCGSFELLDAKWSGGKVKSAEWIGVHADQDGPGNKPVPPARRTWTRSRGVANLKPLTPAPSVSLRPAAAPAVKGSDDSLPSPAPKSTALILGDFVPVPAGKVSQKSRRAAARLQRGA